MMLRVNDTFLDFNGDIEIDRKVKLFQNIEETDGDLSFAFNVELTSNNILALGIPFPDSSSKSVYEVNNTEVLDDNGILINRGSIRVERISGRFASCSFLGGNSNWFALLTGNMTDLDLSAYDKELTLTNIQNSWTEEDGIIFPLIDTGVLITRGYKVFMPQDFLGCMYLHTMLKETFKQSGLKIEGELIEDPFFKSIVVATNTRSLRDVNNNSYFVARLADQVVPGSTAFDPVVMDSFTNPYYVGDDVVIVGNEDFYVSADMLVELEMSTRNTSGTNYLTPNFRVNGTLPVGVKTIRANTGGGVYSITYQILLNEGDYISYGIGNQFGSSLTLDSFTAKVSPLLIYKSFGGSSVPLWTKRQFVSNILGMFNTIVKYDEYTKTVTINLFDKIKEKQSIDISEFIQVEDTDYTEFISEFGKNNVFSYQEGNDEDLRDYNVSSFVKYGAGSIAADNDFLEESVDVFESDFSTPISYVNNVIRASMERIPFVEYIEGNEQDITSVVDDGSGFARFEITDADDYFENDDIVRIQTTETNYNADFKVTSVTSTYIEVLLVDFIGDATGTATKLTHKLTTDDSVYLFSVTKDTPVSDFADSGFFIDSTIIGTSDIAKLAFFNVLRLGQPFEDRYKQGLSFSRPDDQDSFQRTILEKYWTQFERVINDPVMLKCSGRLPWRIYNLIDFLRPITIRSIESSNQYYCNRILGYKDSSQPCEIELIKLP